MLYLDNNATTKPDRNMLGVATQEVSHFFGNPSSLHLAGQASKSLIETAREQVADVLSANKNEIVFTSGGTEANNLALSNYVQGNYNVVVSSVEHSSVYKIGANATIPVTSDCLLSIDALEDYLKRNSGSNVVVSVMVANNETGVLLDPELKLKELKNKYNFILHMDAVQAFTKCEIDMSSMYEHVDLLSVSAHKIHGLKGVGALYIRDSLKRKPSSIMRGGSHERGYRPGTENQIGIFSLGYMAHKLTKDSFYKDLKNRVAVVRDELEKSLLDCASVNGSSHRVYNTTNLFFHEVKDLDLFLEILSENEICVSGKSACSSGMPVPSRVITSMYPDNHDRAEGSVRISLSVFDGGLDIKKVSEKIKTSLEEYKELKENL